MSRVTGLTTEMSSASQTGLCPPLIRKPGAGFVLVAW